MKTPVKKTAAIHDLSGFGRASLSVIIPILSTMGIQACSAPTAVLSTHTGGFKDYEFIDLTNHLENYLNHWAKLDIDFDCVYSGFLGSPKQINIITDFINKIKHKKPLVVIDPVMGDNGELYKTMDETMVNQMKKFIKLADIITPNFTEAAYLLDKEYPSHIEENEMKEWLIKLSDMGPKTVIITSMPDPNSEKNTYVIAYNKEDNRFWKVKCVYIPAFFPGTGDAFTSVIVGSILKGDSLPMALDRGVQFITAAIRASYGYKYPEREGVLLERVLENLKLPVIVSSYEIL